MADRPDDRRDEELSGGQPQPGGSPPVDGQEAGTAATPLQQEGSVISSGPYLNEPPAMDYRTRLLYLRERACKLHGTMATIIAIMFTLIGSGIVTYVLQVLVLIFLLPMVSMSGGSGNSLADTLIAMSSTASWLLALPIAGVVVALFYRRIRTWVESMHATR